MSKIVLFRLLFELRQVSCSVVTIITSKPVIAMCTVEKTFKTYSFGESLTTNVLRNKQIYLLLRSEKVMLC